VTPPRTRIVSWADPRALAERGLELSGLEFLQAIRDGALPQPPIAELLGFALETVEEGRAVFAGEPGEHHYNPIGAVHGGLAATLLDSAMGCAVQSRLPARTPWTTLELGVSFVRPIAADTGRVLAEGTLIHLGRTIATAHGRVTSERTGKLLAHGTTTCLMLAPLS